MRKAESRLDALISERVMTLGGCLVDADGNSYDPSKHGPDPISGGFVFFDPDERDPITLQPLGRGGCQVICYEGRQAHHNYRTHNRTSFIEMLSKGIDQCISYYRRDNLLREPETRDQILERFEPIDETKIRVLKPCTAKLGVYARTLCEDASEWMVTVTKWEVTNQIEGIAMREAPDCIEFAACVGEFMADKLREGRLIFESYNNVVADAGARSLIMRLVEQECARYTERCASLTQIWGNNWYDALRPHRAALHSYARQSRELWKPLPFYKEEGDLIQDVRNLNREYTERQEEMMQMRRVLFICANMRRFVKRFNTRFEKESRYRLMDELRESLEELENIFRGFEFWTEIIDKSEDEQILMLKKARVYFQDFKCDIWNSNRREAR